MFVYIALVVHLSVGLAFDSDLDRVVSFGLAFAVGLHFGWGL